uniref:Uncharacterized protein n=1 Tax=Anguilla anguilla TaxID=7936 RepID=A0A0E9QHN5_ANGAN
MHPTPLTHARSQQPQPLLLNRSSCPAS